MTGRRQQPVDSPQRCHYAADPARRPQCNLTATVQFGTLALCGSCTSQRSSIGKGQPPVPLPDTGPLDVLNWIATAHEQATAAQQILTAAITRARQNGQPWSAIGAQLGITRFGDALYLVETGRFEVQVATPAGQTATINILVPGDFFGELALVRDPSALRRTATVLAAEPLSLPGSQFARICGTHPKRSDS